MQDTQTKKTGNNQFGEFDKEKASFKKETESSTIILDGGMGQELLRLSGAQPTKLWSCQFTLDQPELVQEVHAAYLAAGADVITLNTYTATPSRLRRDADIEIMSRIYSNAFEAATKACADYPNAKIAGCLPPLVASYVAANLPDINNCIQQYRTIVELQPQVDLFLIETMSTILEARAALIATQDQGKPVWVAFSLSDEVPGILRQGDSLEDVLLLIEEFLPDAVLLNCSSPETITRSQNFLQDCRLIPGFSGMTGAYANGFVSVDALQAGGTVAGLKKRENLGPLAYLDYAKQWHEKGARIIGGCCEIGPEHIEVIAKAFQCVNGLK